MAYVITRLCRDCVDADCVSVCPKDCILEHRPAVGEPALPNQLYIDPVDCIDCNACVSMCPWEAIYAEDDVPDLFHEDIALNALASDRSKGFHVPAERLSRKPTSQEVATNKQRWGLSRGAA